MNIGVIILAIIQGIAEFLPISSSAHLIIFRDLFSIGLSSITEEISLTFDIALHFGTLLAIAIFFFKDFINMIFKGFTKGTKDKDGRLFWYIVAATIPAGIAGVLFESKIEVLFRNNFIIIAIALIFMGIVIYLADKYNKSNRNLDKMSLSDALVVGFSQIFALIPGFSRSGTTIAASRMLNFNREDAAKFSFYLSAPVVAGAVLVSLIKDGALVLISANLMIFLTGIIVSFLSGLLCIKFLLKYLKNHDFKLFMWYRIVLGAIVIITVIFK